MASITSDQYFDSAARTAGETFSITNGATLTFRTDTRVHANAPASMTGSIGSITFSSTQVGNVVIDARNVRSLQFNSGSGTVPAIGTTITQGAVSGYLLGVWSSLTVAPTSAGSAMPATGYLKFREVTGGAFSAGALSGISASAVGADVIGWIEIVADISSQVSMYRLNSYKTYGAWFDLGTTTGTPGQILQVPTNGGGANTYCPGVWIETGVGTDQYEFYAGIVTANFTSSNFGTDTRCKFVEMLANGQMRIGSNGTTNIGYTPSSGRKIRIPNIFLRQCASAARASNNTPNTTLATRPRWDSSNSGDIELEYVYGDWYFSFSQAYRVNMSHCAFFDALNISETAKALTITDIGMGLSSSSISSIPVQLTSCKNMTITDAHFYRSNSTIGSHAAVILNCSSILLERVKSGIIYISRQTGIYPLQIKQSQGIVIKDCSCFNGRLDLVTTSETLITDFDYVDVFKGTTISSPAMTAIGLSEGCSQTVIDGITFGLGNIISDCYAQTGLLYLKACTDTVLRNIGSYDSPLQAGATVLGTGLIYSSGGANVGLKVQRVFITGTSGNLVSGDNSDTGFEISNAGNPVSRIPLTVVSASSIMKGCFATATSSTNVAVFDTVFQDFFTSATAGVVSFIGNEPTSIYSDYFRVLAGTVSFTSATAMYFSSINSIVELEIPYIIKGHTSFQNSTPTMSGGTIGNFNISYQVDTGSGYGSLKAATGGNLSSENISNGFKIKIRIENTVAGQTFNYLNFLTNTTAQAQAENYYPLSQSILTLINLKSGSEVRIFKGTDPSSSVEMGGIESSGTSFSLIHYEDGTEGYIIIHALNYLPIYLPWTYTAVDTVIPIQQQIERNYKNE